MPALLQFQSNEELIRQEEDAERHAIEARQNRPEIIGLSAYVRKCWEAAKSAKQPIEQIMLDAMRRCAGEYDGQKLMQIREFGGSEIWMMITDEKCTALESWLEDMLFVPGEDPFSTKPTPEPELAPQVKQRIVERVRAEAAAVMGAGAPVSRSDVADRLKQLTGMVEEHLLEAAKKAEAKAEVKIADALCEANWKKAMKEAIPDLARFPAAFIKGPLFRKKPTLTWGPQGEPIVEDKISMDFEWRSALDIYPAPGSTGIGDGYLIDRHRYTREKLSQFIGVDGFDEEAIRLVLQEFGQGGLRDWLGVSIDTERRRLENRDRESWDPESRIDVLQFWGSVQGLMLLQYGADPETIEDPLMDYQAEVWLVGPYVIKAELNGDPLKRINYYKASFRNTPGSFWGKGLPQVIADKQDACNAAARNLINNMGISSGPQIGVDASANPGGHDYSKMHPWKVWQFDMSKNLTARPPMWFFQPDPMVDALMKVYHEFSAEADSVSGVPKYAYGNNDSAGGAIGTASGLSMMMSNATKGIKRVVGNIDAGWIEPSVQRVYENLMLYTRDPAFLNGDIKLIAVGSKTMVAREQQQIRRNEILQLMLSPGLAELVGPVVLIEMVRSIAKGADLDIAGELPTKEQLLAAMQAPPVDPNQQALPPGEGQTLDAAGNPVAGQDARTF